MNRYFPIFNLYWTALDSWEMHIVDLNNSDNM